MIRARRASSSPSRVPYDHCISRCVRHAFPCDTDSVSGRDFSYPRAWHEATRALVTHFPTAIGAEERSGTNRGLSTNLCNVGM